MRINQLKFALAHMWREAGVYVLVIIVYEVHICNYTYMYVGMHIADAWTAMEEICMYLITTTY